MNWQASRFLLSKLLMRTSFLLILLLVHYLNYSQRSGRRLNSTEIYYPGKILFSPKCVGDSIKIRLEISTNSEKDINLFGFFMSQSNYELSADGTILEKSDTVTINKNHPVKIGIRFMIDNTEIKGPVVRFRSDQTGYQANEMNFEFGADYISVKQIRSGEEVVIDYIERCADSIKVYFPYGGTSSGASLYTDSTSKKVIKEIGYGIGEEGNYLWFSKKDIGRYYVRFGSCHWGQDFWLTIREKIKPQPGCPSVPPGVSP